MMRAALAAISLILLPGYPAAQTVAQADHAANNLSHEAAVCFAYYQIAGHCISLDKSMGDLAESYSHIAENTFLIMTATSELVGVNEKAQAARIGMAVSDMRNAIDDNCTNISVLLAEYADSCLALVEQPDARFEHWLEKAQQ